MNSKSARPGRSGLRLASLAGATALALAGLVPTKAEAKFVFDHNHPDLAWYTIETEHFLVHYPASKKTAEEGNDHYLNPEYSARKSAKVAEEMWARTCAQPDNYLKEKIHIVLLEQTDYLEGFTVPTFDWIVISANPGSYFYRMRGRMEWLSDVLVHEFGHVVSLKRDSWSSEGTQGVLIGALYRDGIRDVDAGAEIFMADSNPFWWSEGVTEFMSDHGGYNWWSNSRDQGIRGTFLEGRMLSRDELLVAFDGKDWGDGERNYQQGFALNAYVRERFDAKATPTFAKKGGEKWRPDWENLIEEVLGITMDQLYDDWREYMMARYQAQYDEVKARGEAVGHEWMPGQGEWNYTDPDGRDAWMAKDRRDREDTREQAGSWEFYPKVSEDGRWLAENNRGGIVVRPRPERTLSALSEQSAGSFAAETMQEASDLTLMVPSEFGHSYDFVPGQDKIVMTGNEHHLGNPYLPGGRIELDGYEWKQIYIADLSPNEKTKTRKHHGEKEEYQHSAPKRFWGKRKDHWRYTPIPGTLRGYDPIVNPAGDRIVYMQYADGGANMVAIDFDGGNKQYLTNFEGSFVQVADWSPDGKQIVFSLFKNQHQDLYLINADGTGIRALNRDPYEDQDPHWANDGRIYFSSDPEGIFNIYAYDVETEKIHQITNVIGGAQMPSITPEGDLLFMNITGHGWKNWTLRQEEFLERDVTDLFQTDVDDKEVEEFLAYKEDLSSFGDLTKKYRATKALMPASAVPIFRVENDSMTNLGLSGGFQFFGMDFKEDHQYFVVAQAGEDPLAVVGYTYSGWYPTIDFMFYHGETKYDYGYLLDDDDNLETTDDQEIYEGRQSQFVNMGMVSLSYSLNSVMDLSVGASAVQYGFRGTSDVKFSPYMQSYQIDANLNYNTVRSYYGHRNARGGRYVDLSYTHGYTDMVYPGYNGFSTDDGELLDAYHYNSFRLDWTEQIPLRGFGIDALKFMGRRGHALEFAFQGGFIDRNVQYQDEFRGGGVHPGYMGSGAVNPNNQFAGYPAFSLSGETMLVASAMYRFPVKTEINKKMGPWYLYDIYGQVGGTAGNFWSFQGPSEEDTGKYYYDSWGQRVAYDPADIKREIPFIDKAYKNGQYMLFDAQAEIRVSSAFSTMSWDSFFRMAWGFQEITGITDPNGDDISETTDTGFGNSLSAETEKPGPRFYVGIGTGW